MDAGDIKLPGEGARVIGELCEPTTAGEPTKLGKLFTGDGAIDEGIKFCCPPGDWGM